jgi:hypothetical protein
MNQNEARHNKRARQSLILLVLMVGGYTWMLANSKEPLLIIIHCLFLLGIARMSLDLFSWWWRRRAPQQKEHRPNRANQNVVRTDNKIWDEVLGDICLMRTEDDYWWQAKLKPKNDEVTIKMAGEQQPDPEIVSEARKLIVNWNDFSQKIRVLVSNETQRMPTDSEDLALLRIESVNFSWPAKPWQAEIYFCGAPSGRLWVCGLEHNDVVGLAAED